ncbi:hypothetical protein GO003_024745 [Methylicorpusculum oleiharenae]|uniref:hypothetical protein n=1 Tax=Methylicorpusculum oleiharenae TaxID=1338687 RepID=UPI00135BED96|nr:hypothetical protein [Methylicorpusculum oleiharenae]MCD2453593.1 hypothetical protein [Methylicorpusculum oleiharenae]
MIETQDFEVMDLTKVCGVFPQLGEPNILRDNMIMTVEGMLNNSEVIIVEGADGAGKTTLLAQFARAFPEQTFCLFMRSSSRWAYDSQNLTRDLCDQIGWALYKEDYLEKDKEVEAKQLLRKRVHELQRKANLERKTYYFVVDGLHEIPEEGFGEKEVILDLIPFGIPRFRFILSGSIDCFLNRLKNSQIRPFQLPGFTLEETRQFFDGYINEPSNLQTIFKVSKGIPGHLASMRRLLESGAKQEEDLLDELPESLPELFEMEWQVVENKDNGLLRNALAILAFDQRRHSINSLALLCNIDIDTLKNKLACCTFVEQKGAEGDIEFIGDVFSRYASKRLSNLRKGTLDKIISDLFDNPESSEAITHLPDLYHTAGRYEELLTYLSPQHIGKLIDCSESWAPLRQKAELGVNTALEQERDGDLLRFSLQRATITSMENSETWRSEIEAYVALEDFSTAYALVQRVATIADRLHLMAVIARMKKSKSLPIELELKDQIQQLYAQLDRSNLGDRGIEIASDLLYTQPELAIDLVQDCMRKSDSDHEGRLDLALANLSFKALIEKQDGVDGMESTHQAFQSKIKNPNVQKFIDKIGIFFGGYTADGVITEVSNWEKVSDRMYALRAWTMANAERDDAVIVVEYAINTILQTTTYTANARVYQELVSPLVCIADLEKVKTIIARLDGLREPIKASGPTLEYVKLQVTLAEAESRYDSRIASDRLLEVYFYIDELLEPGTKLATLAVLAYGLKIINADNQPELHSGLHASVVKGLESVVDEILTKTADHYEAVQSGIGALSRSDSKVALGVITKLNTIERREAALVKLIEATASEQPCNESFSAIVEAYNRIKTIPLRAKATRAALQGLSKQKKNLTSFLTQIYPFRQWVYEIPDAEEKCQALCVFLELIFEHQNSLPIGFLSELQEELRRTWNSIDSGWARVDSGFKIVSRMADSFPEISHEFLKQTEEARKTIILDSPDTANTYFLCVQLAIRCFAGLLKRKLYNEKDDFDDLRDLIEKIPAAHARVIAWSELALRVFMAHDINNCQKIVNEQIRPLLDTEQIRDREALWDATIYAAPVLHCAHSTSAIQIISQIPNPYRDDAYSWICTFLISKRLPMEIYDSASKPEKKVSYEDFLDICNLLEQIENDSVICWHIKWLVDGLHANFRNSFNNTQIADIQGKLLNLAATKFQTTDGIQHEGYKILVEAQIARLDRQKNPWSNLAIRANTLPNLADKAFVLMQVAAAMPNKQKTLALELMQDAKLLIPDIPFFEDRCSHYETLAKLSVDIDRRFSKDCLRQAWSETNPLNAAELPKIRKRIIDFAHRLDPEFAATLASETDDDPGRDFARNQVNRRLQTLNLREQAANGGRTAISKLTQDKKQKIEITKMLLSGLNSDRAGTVHIEETRQDIKDASYMDLQDAYTIFSWAIENSVRRYSDTDQANTILRPLYEAVHLSSELAFRIASRIRSVTDQGIDIARRSDGSSESGLIRPGERNKALDMLKKWVVNATGFIKITDPYFGLEELELVKLIRGEKPDIPVFILAARKHQQDLQIQKPWEESYQLHWRFHVSDADPGDVRIFMIGKGISGSHPIHDRWWLSEQSGLRLGTSANSLGMRLSEMSSVTESEIPHMLAEVDKYISGSVRTIENQRLEHSSFYL